MHTKSVTLLLFFILVGSISVSAREPYPSFGRCILRNECKDQSTKLKLHILHVTKLYDVFDEPEILAAEDNEDSYIKYFVLKTHDNKNLNVGFVVFVSDAAYFVLQSIENGNGKLRLVQVGDCGLFGDIKVVDIDDDGNEDIEFMNYPRGTNLSPSRVQLLNKGNRLIYLYN